MLINNITELMEVGSKWYRLFFFSCLFFWPFFLWNQNIFMAAVYFHHEYLWKNKLQRGLMALADVEGARIQLKQLTIAHHMASWESIQEIIMRHYTRQLLHEMYKVIFQ